MARYHVDVGASLVANDLVQSPFQNIGLRVYHMCNDLKEAR